MVKGIRQRIILLQLRDSCLQQSTAKRRTIITTCDRDRYRRSAAIRCCHSENISVNLTGIQLILCSICRVAPLATAIDRKASITARHTTLGHHTGSRRIKITQH